MISYPGSPPTHRVTGLAAAPSILLILGSLFLAAWRATGRRTGLAAEAAIASLALLAGLLLGRSIPSQSSISLCLHRARADPVELGAPGLRPGLRRIPCLAIGLQRSSVAGWSAVRIARLYRHDRRLHG